MFDDEDIRGALLKCAKGFGTSETVEEFTVEDGELKLIKKKVTKRDVPPDIKAVKLLLDDGADGRTDEELAAEREKLLNMLKEDKFD